MLPSNSNYRVTNRNRRGEISEFVYCIKCTKFETLGFCVAVCAVQKSGSRVTTPPLVKGVLPFFSPLMKEEMIRFTTGRAIWFLPQLHQMHSAFSTEGTTETPRQRLPKL
eukprot:Gregarina_sp_Poly_1__903@NODE_1216_length_4762_cov_60_304579_g830_i0_p3_GENE_NODE_1216_length_4762_cov_60_304579_g830_i0NODE_1216_length_4762_cov_60_304579_g830_i0_p3_ORF_typecomplete_len110_score8_03_NODE_1216_length_4762_cov_60_304579_g830_i027123041